MHRVVPVHEVPDPLPGILDAAEPIGVVALIFHGLELGLTEGIIVTHPWPGVALPDTQDTEEFDHAASHHGAAPVSMQGELVNADVAVGASSFDEFSGHILAFPVRYGPANHAAREDIEDGVEVIEDAFLWATKFRDVPRPALIRAGGFQPGHWVQPAA